MRYEASGNSNLCRNVLNDLNHQCQQFPRRGENIEVCSSCKFREEKCTGCSKVLKTTKTDELYVKVGVGLPGRGELVPWGWLETK